MRIWQLSHYSRQAFGKMVALVVVSVIRKIEARYDPGTRMKDFLSSSGM